MNPIRETNYLALDLELNVNEEGTHEICEIGIALGNIHEIFLTDSKVIKIKQPLFEKTTEITGITQAEIDSGISLNEAAQWLSDIIDTHKPFVNPVTWGLGDSSELLNEFKMNNIHFPYFGRRIIDVKHLFLYIEAANGRSLSGGLKSAMGKHKLKFFGTAHRAECDANNTLRLFFHLLKRQRKLEEIIDTAKFISY
jgi:inhibitor of KinA sporulation pathway (predicted exonuclease)